MEDSNLLSCLRKEITDIATGIFASLATPPEILADLPEVSIVSELAEAFRVSDDVLRSMAESGMPHFHAGRELRFSKPLLIEWQRGAAFECSVCAQKKKAKSGEPDDDPAGSPKSNVTSFSKKTSGKLAQLAGVK